MQKTTAAGAPTASFSFGDRRLHDGSEKNTIIPATALVATKVHAVDSEARPEKIHASFKVVLPNLRYGCTFWRQKRCRKRTPHRWARKNTIRSAFGRDHRWRQDHMQKQTTPTLLRLSCHGQTDIVTTSLLSESRIINILVWFIILTTDMTKSCTSDY